MAEAPPGPMERDAFLSDDGAYRYSLTRRWPAGLTTVDEERPVVWVMLNPSTADARTDDPTIRRVVGFTTALGYAWAVVVNLFALRATDPRDLTAHPDPVGRINDIVLPDVFASAGPVVAAWGAHPFAADRAARVLAMLAELDRTPLCFGRTKAGHPRHPLYLPSTAAAEPLKVTIDG